MALGTTKRRVKTTAPAKLQITSMMDMFTIILIFLLCSFSENPETMKLDKNLKLPESSAKLTREENIKLILTQSELKIEEKTIAKIKNGKIVGLDPKNLKDSSLYHQLKLYRDQQEQKNSNQENDIASATDDDKKSHILFLCDKRLSFKTINNVVKTAGMAGFPNFQFAVLGKDF